MSLADFYAGFATGAACVIGAVVAGTAAVIRKAEETDAFFNRVIDPVPSHVRVIDGQVER